MKIFIRTLLIFIIPMTVLNCNAQKLSIFKPKKVYKTKSLIITQITKNSFLHTSFKQTDDFGYVPCNGLFVRNSNEVVVFDTPTNYKSADELISWINEKLHCKINAIIPTHFHDDCLGGLNTFHNNNIPSYANFKTIELAIENKLVVPKNGFKDSVALKVGNEKVIVKFFGEGHTKDNVIGYFPSEKVMFGGCLIKELDASKGYLGDANTADWSTTVERIKVEYPKVKIVVPGHGEYGNQQLLDYTINLFRAQ